MTDGEYEVGSIQSVEVKFANACASQGMALLCRHRRSDKLAALGVVVEIFEKVCQPGWNAGTTSIGEAPYRLEIGHRQNAGNDRHPNTVRSGSLQEAEKDIGIEEKLSDRAVCASVYLSFQIIQIGLRGCGVGVDLRISSHRNLKISDLLESAHEGAGVTIAAGMGCKITRAVGRVTAKRHDVLDSHILITSRNVIDLACLGSDAREVRGDRRSRLPREAGNRAMGAFAYGAAGAICDGDEAGCKGGQSFNSPPERGFHFRGLRREELERNP